MLEEEIIEKMIDVLELEQANCTNQYCRDIINAKIHVLKWVLLSPKKPG